MFTKLQRTNRGFRFYEFEDRNDYKCQLQKSSVATEDCIWLGLESASPKKLVLNKGWLDVELPEGVETNTRMHLTREQAKHLAKMLNYFAEVGQLPSIALD